jgi:hypothetical protein
MLTHAHVCCRPPIFLLCVVVAMLHGCRAALLSAHTLEQIKRILRTPAPQVQVAELLSAAAQLSETAALLHLRITDAAASGAHFAHDSSDSADSATQRLRCQ